MILGISETETGAIHYGICPTELDKDGQVKKWCWLDQSRISLIEHPEKNTLRFAYERLFGMFDVVKDKHTDIKGTVVAITDYDTGCTTYTIQPRELNKDNTEAAPVHFLEANRLELIKAANVEPASTRKPTSPYGNNPPESNH